MKGTVKWFNDSRGYGFLTPSAGGSDIFVHFSDIQGEGFKTLFDGEEVEFEIATSQRGTQARSVTPVRDSAVVFYPVELVQKDNWILRVDENGRLEFNDTLSKNDACQDFIHIVMKKWKELFNSRR